MRAPYWIRFIGNMAVGLTFIGMFLAAMVGPVILFGPGGIVVWFGYLLFILLAAFATASTVE